MYATIDELKSAIGKTKNDDDLMLELLLNAASKAIDLTTGYVDGFAASVATSREFVGSGIGYQYIDDCAEPPELVEVKTSFDGEYEAWDVGDWVAASGTAKNPQFGIAPYNLLIVQLGGSKSYFTSGKSTFGDYWGMIDTCYYRTVEPRAVASMPTVRVTAKWGYSTTPPTTIKAACIMQAARWYKRLQGSMADALANTDMGEPQFVKTLDPDVKALLYINRYVKPSI